MDPQFTFSRSTVITFPESKGEVFTGGVYDYLRGGTMIFLMKDVCQQATVRTLQKEENQYDSCRFF